MAEQYKFPDEQDDEKTSQVKVSVEDDGDVEVEVIDDTPIQDRGRKPLDREVEDRRKRRSSLDSFFINLDFVEPGLPMFVFFMNVEP
jgi:hypothetical protein